MFGNKLNKNNFLIPQSGTLSMPQTGTSVSSVFSQNVGLSPTIGMEKTPVFSPNGGAISTSQMGTGTSVRDLLSPAYGIDPVVVQKSLWDQEASDLPISYLETSHSPVSGTYGMMLSGKADESAYKQSATLFGAFPKENQYNPYSEFRYPDGTYDKPAVSVLQQKKNNRVYFEVPPEHDIPLMSNVSDQGQSVTNDMSTLFQYDVDPDKYHDLRKRGYSNADIVKLHQEYDTSLIEQVVKRLLNPVHGEGDLDFIYVDSKGVLTYGIGINIEEFETFKKIPWLDKSTQKYITDEMELKAIHDTLIKKKEKFYNDNKELKDAQKNIYYLNVPAYSQKSKGFSSTLTTDADVRRKLTVEHVKEISLPEIKEHTRRLKKRFYSEPPSAQIGLIDMAYNLGRDRFRLNIKGMTKDGSVGKKDWPNFTGAFINRDYLEMARECERGDVQPARNDMVYNLFKDATMENCYGIRGGPYYDSLSDYWDNIERTR